MCYRQMGLILVLLWLPLLHLAPAKELSGIPPRAVLLLHPPLSTTFKGESVTLTCMDSLSLVQGPITWFLDSHVWKNEPNSITITKSGHYQCKTERSSISEPVHVKFLSDEVILQASPQPIFEGDNVFLKCQRKGGQLNSIFFKDGKKLESNNSDTIKLYSVLRDNSKYSCTAFWKPLGIISWSKTSRPLNIQIQELFLPPVLTFSPSWPIEGYPVTLNCETRLPPQRSYVQLQFCFFKDGQLLGSGCNSSSKIQLPTMWLEDSGSYRCQAEAVTYNIIKSSSIFKIRVQRIPVSDVNLEIRPPGGLLIEGENLVLICSVAKGTGTITFSWHKDGTSVGKKTQQSLLAELLVPTVKTHNAGRYYCVADNGAPILSNRIQVTVRSLVSRPVLILRTPRDQALVGDMVELHCEALRGSPPIWYQFYHEDVTLGNSSAPNGGGTSFNFSLTEEHSGNYSCEADNGLGPQRSHRVSLKVIVPVSDIVLNLQTPGSQATIGEEVEIYCEALKGSPPILYQFYHDNIPLGVSLAPTEGGASFKFFVTTERAGNYSCEADNGLEPQRSEVITFSIAGPQRSRAGLISAGVIVGLLGVLSLAAVILLYHFRTQRQSELSAPETPRPSDWQESFLGLPSIDPQDHLHAEHPALMELQPIYNNVNPGGSNMVYSQIQHIWLQKGNSANSPKVCQKDKEPVVIYSELRTAHCDASARQVNSDQDDDTQNYENVPTEPAVSDH